MTIRQLSYGALLLASGVAIAVACGDPSHIYEGRAYIDGRDCLGTDSSIDVVTGGDPGFCNAVCLSQVTDAGRQLYVSTMCAPFPYPFDAAGTDPSCPRALAALGRNDTCNVDGVTSTDPIEAGADGGADASDQ